VHFLSFLFLYCAVFLSQAADLDMTHPASRCAERNLQRANIDPFHWINILGPFRLILSKNPCDNREELALLETKLGVSVTGTIKYGEENENYHCFFIPTNLDDAIEHFFIHVPLGCASKISSLQCYKRFADFSQKHLVFLRNWDTYFSNHCSTDSPSPLTSLPEGQHFSAVADCHVQNILSFLSQGLPIHIEDIVNFLTNGTVCCIAELYRQKSHFFRHKMLAIEKKLFDQTFEAEMCAEPDVQKRIDLIAEKLQQSPPYFRPLLALDVFKRIRMPEAAVAASYNIAGIGLKKDDQYAPFTASIGREIDKRVLREYREHTDVSIADVWQYILDQLGAVCLVPTNIRESVDILCFLHDINERSFRRMLALEHEKEYSMPLNAQPSFVSFTRPIIDFLQEKEFKNPMLQESLLTAFALLDPPEAPDESATIEEWVDAAKALSMEYEPYASKKVSKRSNLLHKSVSLEAFIADAVPLYDEEKDPDHQTPWIIKLLHTAKEKKVCLPLELIEELSLDIARLKHMLSSVKNFASHAKKRSVEDILLDDLSPANLLNIIEQSIANAHVCLHDTALAYMSALTEASRSSLRNSVVLIKIESMDNLRGWVSSFYDLALHGVIDHARIDKLLQKIDEIAKRLDWQTMLPLELNTNWIFDKTMPAIPRSANEFNQLNGVERASIMTMFEKNIPLLDSIEAQILAVSDSMIYADPDSRRRWWLDI